MKKRKVINGKNVPYGWPLNGTIVWLLLLDRFSAPGWLWGIFATLIAIVWLLIGTDIFSREELPPFKD